MVPLPSMSIMSKASSAETEKTSAPFGDFFKSLILFDAMFAMIRAKSASYLVSVIYKEF